MRCEIDPIFITPRMLPRSWGKSDLDEWCAGAPRPPIAVGEIWTAHAHNMTDTGVHFGARLNAAPRDILGDLGRAPPSLRLITTGAEVSPVLCDGPLALWRILDARPGAVIESKSLDAMRKPARAWTCAAGDMFRASDRAWLKFSSDVLALEARANFQPRNEPDDAEPFLRVEPPANPDATRAALLRDAALSVELWRLPEHSRLEPDGETCHVLMALTPGVSLDGRTLARGEAVFMPANGRRVHLAGRDGELLVAYPDIVPTSIWRHAPDPDPTAAALSRAAAERTNVADETVYAAARMYPSQQGLARAA